MLEVCQEDASVANLRRHGNPDGVSVVLSHGNGLAINRYYPPWSLLCDEFDIFLYDLRNHGWNSVGPRRSHHIPAFIQDQDRVLESIDRYFGEKPKIGILNSVSALTTFFSPAQNDTFSALVLFDPPLCKLGTSQEEFDPAAENLAARIRQRSSRFRSVAEFAELLQYKLGYLCVVSGVRTLAARTTLRKPPRGKGYELRCPAEYEAQITEYVRGFPVLADPDSLSCPTKVIGADPTLPTAYLPTLSLSHILTVDDDFLPETTHLLRLEKPTECANLAREFLRGINVL